MRKRPIFSISSNSRSWKTNERPKWKPKKQKEKPKKEALKRIKEGKAVEELADKKRRLAKELLEEASKLMDFGKFDEVEIKEMIRLFSDLQELFGGFASLSKASD